MRRYHTITDIVSTAYCEQRVIFGIRYGKRISQEAAAKAKSGTSEHAKYEKAGYTRQNYEQKKSQDKRCFIASHVFGPNAAQTNSFRDWRDEKLIHSLSGRLFVSLYYRISPKLLPLLQRSERLTSITRRVLTIILRRIKGGLA